MGQDSKILQQLEERESNEGALPKYLELYRGLLCLQSEAGSRVGVPGLDLSEEAVGERIKNGSPVLGFDDLTIDWSLLQSLFEEVRELFGSYSEVLGKVPENLGDSGSYLSRLKEVTRAWYEGNQLPSWLPAHEVSEALLELIIHGAFKPFLVRHCEAVLGLVNQEQWRRGYCPVCGGNPDFASLEKERGARWLICSRCDAEWLFQRLECPYCGTLDQSDLAYFTDDKGLYRLYVCERCRHYLKAIDLRQAEYEVLLPLERFLTIDIDAQAHRDGYSPGTKAGQSDRGDRGVVTTLLTEGKS